MVPSIFTTVNLFPEGFPSNVTWYHYKMPYFKIVLLIGYNKNILEFTGVIDFELNSLCSCVCAVFFVSGFTEIKLASNTV